MSLVPSTPSPALRPAPRSRYGRALLLLAVASVLLFLGRDRARLTVEYARWWVPIWWASEQRVYDEANLVPSHEEEVLESALAQVLLELDLDVRLAYVRGLDGRSIEEASLALLEERGIGRRTGAWRGLLFLYDAESHRARIEVGYGLEEWFPDALLSWIVHEHTRDFLAYGDAARAFTWTVPLLLLRLRQANLEGGYEPSRPDALALSEQGGGGAGAGLAAPLGRDAHFGVVGELPADVRARLTAGATPEETIERYVTWMRQPVLDPDAGLLTPDSRHFVRTAPQSPVMLACELETLPGRALAFDVRGDLALVYATDDPFTHPYFLRRGAEGWQMDLPAQWRNVQVDVGHGYAWTLTPTADEHGRTFADRRVRIAGALRIVGGDNRRFGTQRAEPSAASSATARAAPANPPARGAPPLAPFPDSAGWSPLHLAAAEGDAARVSSLLADGARVSSRNENGRTPLYEAAKRGRSEAVRLLLARGADPNDTGARHGMTPFHVAAEYQHRDVLELLLRAGGRADVRTPEGLTPLHQLANFGGEGAAALVPLLVAAGAPANDAFPSPLRRAVKAGDAALARALIDSGASPNITWPDGWTPLHLAADLDDADLVESLVAAGARLDLRLPRGATPLGVALRNGRARAAEALLEAGATPETGLGADFLATAEASGDAATIAAARRALRIDARE